MHVCKYVDMYMRDISMLHISLSLGKQQSIDI